MLLRIGTVSGRLTRFSAAEQIPIPLSMPFICLPALPSCALYTCL